MISYLGSSTSLCTHFINKNPGFRNQNFDLQNAKSTFGADKIKSNEAPNRLIPDHCFHLPTSPQSPPRASQTRRNSHICVFLCLWEPKSQRLTRTTDLKDMCYHHEQIVCLRIKLLLRQAGEWAMPRIGMQCMAHALHTQADPSISIKFMI